MKPRKKRHAYLKNCSVFTLLCYMILKRYYQLFPNMQLLNKSMKKHKQIDCFAGIITCVMVWYPFCTISVCMNVYISVTRRASATIICNQTRIYCKNYFIILPRLFLLYKSIKIEFQPTSTVQMHISFCEYSSLSIK